MSAGGGVPVAGAVPFGRAAPAAIPRHGRVLGVDLGTSRVGVAVSDGDQRLAVGATRLDRPTALVAVVRDYEAVGVVVGLPLSLSGGRGPAAVRALDQVEELRRTLDVPVEVVDERFSTVSATASLRAAGRPGRRQRQVVDQTAAAVFLQVWLDRRRAREETSRV